MERRFSVNKECLVENMKEESLVAQRLVFDEVSAAGGVSNVDIQDRMTDMVRGANIKWKEELSRKSRCRMWRERKRELLLW